MAYKLTLAKTVCSESKLRRFIDLSWAFLSKCNRAKSGKIQREKPEKLISFMSKNLEQPFIPFKVSS